MFHIATESFDNILPFVRDVAQSHWNEAAAEGYGEHTYVVNEEKYVALEALGMLHITTARDGIRDGVRNERGSICGYAAFVVAPCFHKAHETVATLCALYIAEEARGGMLALRMLRKAEGFLRDLGIARVQYFSPTSRPCDALFRRLGARHAESVFVKIL